MDALDTKAMPNGASYTVENRQFIVRRVFSQGKTVKDLLVSEISQGILQNTPLNNVPASDILM